MSNNKQSIPILINSGHSVTAVLATSFSMTSFSRTNANMKATISETKKRKKTVFGLPSSGAADRRTMTGKLVEHFCSKCESRIVMAPDDCDSVTCGTCMFKSAHNAMLDPDHAKRVNAKPKKEGKG